MFPVLECIMVTITDYDFSPGVFRAALEDRLNLATVKELHFAGRLNLPLSLLDNCKNIKNLSLLGPLQAYPEGRVCDSALPQLESLTLLATYISSPLLNWIKLHINKLQSLKCSNSGRVAVDLLGVCSGTLIKMDVDLDHTLNPVAELSPFPPNLHQLTIRAPVRLETPNSCCSYLPAAAEVIKLLVSSPRHLVLDIDISLPTSCNLTRIDFSPLAVLGAASLSIPRIDVYIRTGVFPSVLTLSQIVSSLEDYENIAMSIKKGVLVIHSEKTAPDCVVYPDA